MEYVDKIVKFEDYCSSCEYFKSNEALDPCHECLNNPTNQNSRKPVNYKKAEKKDNKK